MGGLCKAGIMRSHVCTTSAGQRHETLAHSGNIASALAKSAHIGYLADPYPSFFSLGAGARESVTLRLPARCQRAYSHRAPGFAWVQSTLAHGIRAAPSSVRCRLAAIR